ncbi:GNAT family N-acetyltransferase [Dyadobacter sp. CY323]|uniref:GNAT family N-acetyltransferase n=1 Tax=Dyadobacter sp. CY323 TaxID=2907302 RepID=UPI001F3203BC|nr:GNAT family N-acetyltransferase [Dyadobacter sp. CY323]MCE6993026.1 GNAT family N-acetyltransferase [Dyadobacter sp. CY323]
MDNLTFLSKSGRGIESVLHDLAQLRITVFHDYPYLYEGSVDYEMEYLKVYLKSDRSFLFAVYDGDRMVGATTCIPLADEASEVRKPFEDAGFNVQSIFYFGESILLPEYRGSGIGHRFFDEREAHATSFGTYAYELSCFCSVDRGESHPAEPANYRPNDAFWIKRGYIKEPGLRTYMSWPDLGESESSLKPMIFWTKKLD